MKNVSKIAGALFLGASLLATATGSAYASPPLWVNTSTPACPPVSYELSNAVMIIEIWATNSQQLAWHKDDPAALDQSQERLDEFRSWAAANVKDRCLLATYNHWADMHQSSLNQYRDRIKQKAKTHLDVRQRDLYLRQLPKPPGLEWK